MVKHVHEAVRTDTRPYTGTVSKDENNAAHGGICEVETCACGYFRRTNVNGRHTEQGHWEPGEDQRTAWRIRDYLRAHGAMSLTDIRDDLGLTEVAVDMAVQRGGVAFEALQDETGRFWLGLPEGK
jgi:hypothetical protein